MQTMQLGVLTVERHNAFAVAAEEMYSITQEERQLGCTVMVHVHILKATDKVNL